MKWKIRVKKWLGILLFAVLSVVVFYTSYVVEQKSLTVSLFGLFFVLLMGLLAFKLDHWSDRFSLTLGDINTSKLQKREYDGHKLVHLDVRDIESCDRLVKV
ncbi:hypothetical protein GCM10009001_06080 [Virgibacillus siamensis]|uniref:Uncharacterized protein n=1 Tax=Virgibacillus siamensis TaxID=480071 RepID=A0ABN1FKT3_9BACI